ncbi:MAG: hypothetical protein ACHQF0_02425 [Chitinophagales bacterium]
MRIRIQIVIVLLLWCYIIYRAFFISITQDEAHTYLLVKTNNWRQALGTTNTHWLNSFFIKLFLLLPGPDRLWKIRMLPVLSWIVYSYSTIRLSSSFKSRWIGFVFFVVAIFNPFLIFYFSLARGYAPACAFIMLSLWLATKYIRANDMTPRNWFPVFFAASIATLFNFVTFYFFIGLVCAFLLQLLVNKKFNTIFHSHARPLLFLISGTSIVTLGALFLIRSMDNLWFPGTRGIINSLFGSMIQTLSYFDNNSISFYRSYYKEGVSFLLNGEIQKTYQAIGFVIALLFAVAFSYSTYLFSRSKKLALGFLSLFLCLAIILFNFLFHLLFKTPYLFERTTLILFPPLVVGLFCFIDKMSKDLFWFKRTVNVLLSLVVVVFGFNYYKSFSLNYFPDWPVQTNTKECLDFLQASHAKMVGINEWHYSVFINYYSRAYPNKYTFNCKVLSDKEQLDSLNTSLLPGFDYLLLAPPYNDSVLSKNRGIKLNFPASGAKVLENDTSRNSSHNLYLK